MPDATVPRAHARASRLTVFSAPTTLARHWPPVRGHCAGDDGKARGGPMAARGNLLVGQSGGATAVINASLVGLIEAALWGPEVGAIVGMRQGIEGLLKGELVDLRRQPAEALARLRRTPSAALGPGRHKLSEDDPGRALALLQQHDIRYFLYI